MQVDDGIASRPRVRIPLGHGDGILAQLHRDLVLFASPGRRPERAEICPASHRAPARVCLPPAPPTCSAAGTGPFSSPPASFKLAYYAHGVQDLL